MSDNWVSVEDSLPVLPCLTFWDDGCIEAYNSNESINIGDLMADDQPWKVTHWQPLPPPPGTNPPLLVRGLPIDEIEDDD